MCKSDKGKPLCLTHIHIHSILFLPLIIIRQKLVISSLHSITPSSCDCMCIEEAEIGSGGSLFFIEIFDCSDYNLFTFIFNQLGNIF